MTQIGKNIKKIRNVRGLSQQAFADLFALTRGNISSYEELRAEPKIDVLMKIANYFGIPLADFIEKDLSVNELLHYNTKLVLETEKLKITDQLVSIPYIPYIYIKDFALKHAREDLLKKLPTLTVPSASRFRLIAIEFGTTDDLPAGANYHPGDVLIWEQVGKENVHRIAEKTGLMLADESLKWGIYQPQPTGGLKLALNEWVQYPFDVEDGNREYWVLRAVYAQV